MPGDPKNPAHGDLSIDATECEPYIKDLAPGALQGLRIEKEGLSDVLSEVTANQPVWGDKAGVTQGDFAEFTTISDRIKRIDAFLGAARKLVELLEETRAALVDQRERVIHAFAKSVDGRAKTPGGEALLAKYEKTRAYRSLTANKAVKTRQRNAQAAEAETPATPATPATPKPPAPTGG